MAYFRNEGGVLRAPGQTLNGTPGPDILTGGPDDDLIAGLDGDDTLTGLAGADVLDGGHGADHMDGGLGDDSYWVDAAGDVVVEAVGQGFDTVVASVDYTLPDNIENMILIGAITGTGNDQANLITGDGAAHTIFGMGGDDVLVGGTGNDKMAGGTGNDAYWLLSTGPLEQDSITELPGEGFDTIATTKGGIRLSSNVEQLILLAGATTGFGNDQANILVGNDANNYLDGEGGDDRMIGGLGDDIYIVEQSGDMIVELPGEGFDRVMAYADTYVLPNNIEYVFMASASIGDIRTGTGNADDNIMEGSVPGMTLIGLGGDDYLRITSTGGTLIGGEGDDAYNASGSVTIVELAGEGFDTLLARDSHVLEDNVEQLILAAGATAISATGNAQDNILVGNAQNNVLKGLGGNDLMTGGAGVDRFIVGPGADTDVITDFGAGGAHDALDVSAYITASITWTTAQVGADTFVSFANGDQVILLNFLETQLHQSGGDLLA